MSLRDVIPILRIFSLKKAYDFYLNYLGFEVDWEHRFEEGFPLYCQVRRDAVVIHLSEHYGDSTPGSTIFVPSDDIERLHQELQVKQFVYAKPMIEEVGWGRQMQISDPFGNRLRFCQLS